MTGLRALKAISSEPERRCCFAEPRVPAVLLQSRQSHRRLTVIDLAATLKVQRHAIYAVATPIPGRRASGSADVE